MKQIVLISAFLIGQLRSPETMAVRDHDDTPARCCCCESADACACGCSKTADPVGRPTPPALAVCSCDDAPVPLPLASSFDSQLKPANHAPLDTASMTPSGLSLCRERFWLELHGPPLDRAETQHVILTI